MIRSLPDEALRKTTVAALESHASVVDTYVIFVVGGGNAEFVTQFALETESTLHALSLAAPDDPDREGWFALESVELPPEGGHALRNAENAAAAYRTEFELDSEVEVTGPAIR